MVFFSFQHTCCKFRLLVILLDNQRKSSAIHEDHQNYYVRTLMISGIHEDHQNYYVRRLMISANHEDHQNY